MWVSGTSSPFNLNFGIVESWVGEGAWRATSSIFQNVTQSFRKTEKLPNIQVNRLALTLGDRDATTGWYALEYEESTIDMVVVTQNNQQFALGLGYYVQLDALGFTTDYVRVYDKIVDSVNRTWLVKEVTPVTSGDVLHFYKVDLKELPTDAL